MARRKLPPPPPIESREFTISEIDRGVAKLQRRIEEVRSLESQGVRHNDAKKRVVESNITDTIRDVFGPNSPELREHGHLMIWDGGYNIYDTPAEQQAKFLAGVSQTVTLLEGLIARLEEKREDVIPHGPTTPALIAPPHVTRKVFVVHGHDEAAKQSVARYLEKLELEAIILHEEPNKGRTLIEKFEEHSDVGFAVVLLTPDDVGYPKDDPKKAMPRARQNVIFELGYFVGHLKRSRVCALHRPGVEILSDYEGVVYIPFDEGGAWQLLLAREIKAAGMDINLNLAI